MAHSLQSAHHFRLRSEPLASRETSFSSAEKSQKRRGVILLQRSSFPPDFFGTKASIVHSNQNSILRNHDLSETFGNPNAKALLEKKRKLNKFLSKVSNRQSFLKTMANNQLVADRTNLSKKSDQQSTQETPKFQQQKPEPKESRHQQADTDFEKEKSLNSVKKFTIRPGNFFIQKRLTRAEDLNNGKKMQPGHLALLAPSKRFIDNSESIFDPFSRRKNSEDINQSLNRNVMRRKIDNSVQMSSQTRPINIINDQHGSSFSKPLLSLKSKLKSTISKRQDNSELLGNFSFTKPPPSSFLFTIKSILQNKEKLPELNSQKDSALMRKAYQEQNNRRLDEVIELKQILDSKQRNVLESPAKAFSRPIVPSLLKTNVKSVSRARK